MYWLICFDIQDDRTRTRVSRYLEKVGVRVQGSVFEVVLRKESQRNRLIKSLQRIIAECEEPGADIRFYRMNEQTIAMSHTLEGKVDQLSKNFLVKLSRNMLLIAIDTKCNPHSFLFLLLRSNHHSLHAGSH